MNKPVRGRGVHDTDTSHDATYDLTRRVLLVSPYNAIPRPWYGVAYEFLNVIAGIEAATIVAPAATPHFEGTLKAVAPELSVVRHKAMTLVHRATGRASVAQMQVTQLDADYDLCFYMCQFPHELPEIGRVRHWRQRSGRACAFLLETWSHVLAKCRNDLQILDQFDHVFVFNAESIPLLRQYTSTPISFLPTGADCLIPDSRHPPERSIDVLSIGRRTAEMHACLLDCADRHGLFYVYDAFTNMSVRDWASARRMNAEQIRRAKYFMVWNPTALQSRGIAALANQNAISTRYFEGAAGGAVLLGSRPNVAEFDRLFDWPDAVVDLPTAPEEVWAVIAGLNADPARRARIGLTNRAQSLRRHDWAYRWATVLKTLGLARTKAHDMRIATLLRRAAAEEMREDMRGQQRLPAREAAGPETAALDRACGENRLPVGVSK